MLCLQVSLEYITVWSVPLTYANYSLANIFEETLCDLFAVCRLGFCVSWVFVYDGMFCRLAFCGGNFTIFGCGKVTKKKSLPWKNTVEVVLWWMDHFCTWNTSKFTELWVWIQLQRLKMPPKNIAMLTFFYHHETPPKQSGLHPGTVAYSSLLTRFMFCAVSNIFTWVMLQIPNLKSIWSKLNLWPSLYWTLYQAGCQRPLWSIFW